MTCTFTTLFHVKLNKVEAFDKKITKLFHENPIFETMKFKIIISLFGTVGLSVSILQRNLYNSLKRIKEQIITVNSRYLDFGYLE